MDESLEHIVRNAVTESRILGFTRETQRTIYAVQAVRKAKPAMTASDALAAVKRVTAS